MMNPPCPTPNKKSYDRKSWALKAADKVNRFEARVYLCECNRWHISSVKMRDKVRDR